MITEVDQEAVPMSEARREPVDERLVTANWGLPPLLTQCDDRGSSVCPGAQLRSGRTAYCNPGSREDARSLRHAGAREAVPSADAHARRPAVLLNHRLGDAKIITDPAHLHEPGSPGGNPTLALVA